MNEFAAALAEYLSKLADVAAASIVIDARRPALGRLTGWWRSVPRRRRLLMAVVLPAAALSAGMVLRTSTRPSDAGHIALHSDAQEASIASSATAQSPIAPHVPRPAVQAAGPVMRLFNLTDFSGWNKYVVWTNRSKKPPGKDKDPDRIYTVVNGTIRISGEHWGTLTTEQEFDNYQLTVEFKWGKQTWGDRKKLARLSGVFLHCIGRHDAYNKWMPQSIECRILEGATGDLRCCNVIRSKTQTSFAVESESLVIGEARRLTFKPGAPLSTIGNGYVRRLHLNNNPEWRDVAGFHRQGDVEKPTGEWNTLEIYCLGNRITVVLNGVV
ncbi:MAG: 3-keto-disaccharide hydrolase, partial [Pirellulales bacterium]